MQWTVAQMVQSLPGSWHPENPAGVAARTFSTACGLEVEFKPQAGLRSYLVHVHDRQSDCRHLFFAPLEHVRPRLMEVCDVTLARPGRHL